MDKREIVLTGDKKVILELNITDLKLVLVNVLIALHRSKQIDLESLLPSLEEVTKLTGYRPEGEDAELHSRASLMLLQNLRDLRKLWQQ